MTKTKTTIVTSLTALMLLAVATVLPACEILRDCNPEIEMCEFDGTHPGGLDPNP